MQQQQHKAVHLPCSGLVGVKGVAPLPARKHDPTGRHTCRTLQCHTAQLPAGKRCCHSVVTTLQIISANPLQDIECRADPQYKCSRPAVRPISPFHQQKQAAVETAGIRMQGTTVTARQLGFLSHLSNRTSQVSRQLISSRDLNAGHDCHSCSHAAIYADQSHLLTSTSRVSTQLYKQPGLGCRAQLF
jgi:hypothetical protein